MGKIIEMQEKRKARGRRLLDQEEYQASMEYLYHIFKAKEQEKEWNRLILETLLVVLGIVAGIAISYSLLIQL